MLAELERVRCREASSQFSPLGFVVHFAFKSRGRRPEINGPSLNAGRHNSATTSWSNRKAWSHTDSWRPSLRLRQCNGLVKKLKQVCECLRCERSL